jgi:hypothetical protein
MKQRGTQAARVANVSLGWRLASLVCRLEIAVTTCHRILLKAKRIYSSETFAKCAQ